MSIVDLHRVPKRQVLDWFAERRHFSTRQREDASTSAARAVPAQTMTLKAELH